MCYWRFKQSDSEWSLFFESRNECWIVSFNLSRFKISLRWSSMANWMLLWFWAIRWLWMGMERQMQWLGLFLRSLDIIEYDLLYFIMIHSEWMEAPFIFYILIKRDSRTNQVLSNAQEIQRKFAAVQTQWLFTRHNWIITMVYASLIILINALFSTRIRSRVIIKWLSKIAKEHALVKTSFETSIIEHFKGYDYYGLQNGNECYCGNSIFGAIPAYESQCNRPCTGDRSQYCGGSWRLKIFKTEIENQLIHITGSMSIDKNIDEKYLNNTMHDQNTILEKALETQIRSLLESNSLGTIWNRFCLNFEYQKK